MNARIAEIRSVLDESEFTLLTEKLQKALLDADDIRRRLETKESDLADVNRERQYFKKRLEERTLDKNALDVKNAKLDESQALVLLLSSDIERCRVQIEALDEKAAAVAAEVEEIRWSVTEDVACSLSLDEIEEGIATTERAIRKLGAVNMLAIEQYNEAVAKSDERTARKDMLSSEREALLERIESFAQMKFDAFMDAYNAIDTNFQDILRG